MPELPEVETVRLQLLPVLCQKKIKTITINRPNLRFPFPKNLAAILQGTNFTHIHRHGKYLILKTEGAYSLLVHLGMTGRFLIGSAEDSLPDFYYKQSLKPEHEHIVFHFEDGLRVGFYDPRRFGYMDLVLSHHLYENKFLRVLGFDALSIKNHIPLLYDRFQKLKAPIKTTLLNQHIIAGIGNIYASEALWRSHILPTRPCESLTMMDIHHLAVHIYDVLSDALNAGGSTLKDYHTPDGKKGQFQTQFSVYDCDKKACMTPSCTGIIEKSVMAGRMTYFCSVCQK